jgi:hypothetical protein
MTLVDRWFVETTEGDTLDGPFKTKREADIAADTHERNYKYTPVVNVHQLDSDSFTQPENSGDFYY